MMYKHNIMAVLFVLIFGFVSSCATIKIPEGPEAYRKGYKHGCTSGRLVSGISGYKYIKDKKLINDDNYKKGWKEGFKKCAKVKEKTKKAQVALELAQLTDELDEIELTNYFTWKKYKAFALNPNNRKQFWWNFGYDDLNTAKEKALEYCGEGCVLFAINDELVWPENLKPKQELNSVKVTSDPSNSKLRSEGNVDYYSSLLQKNPNDAQVYYNRGISWYDIGKFGKAITDLTIAVRLTPNDPILLNRLAWFLSTCPNPHYRDGSKAVELASKAVRLRPNDGRFIDTLAAAYAESSRFEKAVVTQKRAINILESQNRKINPSVFERLKHYELALTSQNKSSQTSNVGVIDIAQNQGDDNKLSNIEINATSVRWAVIIGISTYQDTHVPSLRYASLDAQSFYDWAVSPIGGKYAPSRVKLLLNEEATGLKIKKALFEWLSGALSEDMVTIYFAGHGSPESPDSLDNLFLLPYDTQYQSISTTAFPMWDIETALKRFIKAKKVVVIADACHSGGVGKSFDVARRSNRGIKVNQISSGIQNLSQIGDGICVISASSENQFSQESQHWGGGHGVFTFFLLEGLKGDADYNKDNSVTLGELTSYLSEQVRRETKNAQSPTVAGRYDPALTIGR